MTDTEYMAGRGFSGGIVTEDEVGIVQFKDKCLEKGTAVHLRTKEQCNEFSKWLDSKGMKWYNGQSYIDEDEWYIYTSDTCYNPHGESYSDRGFCAKTGCRILSYEEALLNQPPSMEKINKEITKEVEAIKALPTDVLIVMLYNHVCSDEQLLEGFFEQVEDELKFRLDDYDSLCWAMADNILEDWIIENVTGEV